MARPSAHSSAAWATAARCPTSWIIAVLALAMSTALVTARHTASTNATGTNARARGRAVRGQREADRQRDVERGHLPADVRVGGHAEPAEQDRQGERELRDRGHGDRQAQDLPAAAPASAAAAGTVAGGASPRHAIGRDGDRRDRGQHGGGQVRHVDGLHPDGPVHPLRPPPARPAQAGHAATWASSAAGGHLRVFTVQPRRERDPHLLAGHVG